MADRRPPLKITVLLESRPDGGLRAWSESVPGFVLSHADATLVLADVPIALGVILGERLGQDVVVEMLVDAGTFLSDTESVEASAGLAHSREYVALHA